MREKINQRKFITVFLIGCFAFVPSFKAFADDYTINEGETLTIDRCVEIAMHKNPSINLEVNTSRVMQSKIGQIKSDFLPQLGLTTGYNRQNFITDSDKDIAFNNYSGNIWLNQLIYDFGRTSGKSKIASLNVNSSKYDIENAVIQVAYNVKAAYYQSLSAKLNIDIIDKSIKQYERHLKQSNAFFEVGTKAKIDVINAEVNLSNAKLNYIKANNTYKLAIANLNNAMGIFQTPQYKLANTLTYRNKDSDKKEEPISSKEKPNSVQKINNKAVLKSNVSKNNMIDNLVLEKYDINLENALKKAFENRPDLKARANKESAAKESVKLIKRDYYPRISSFASYGAGGSKSPLDSGWAIGANVTLPVFNGLLTNSQLKEGKANLDVVKSEIDILKQNIYLEVQQAYINITETEKRIPVAEIIVKQAKENLDLSNGRYNVGVGNFIELQGAETNYNNAQLSYIQTLYDYNIARCNLEKSMGVK